MDTNESLSCVLIPAASTMLLLPNVTIAEVVDLYATEAAEDGPEWLSGELEWRGLTLPIVSYNAANGGERIIPSGVRGRIAVLNTIGDSHSAAPFMALLTQGIPSQIKLQPDQIRQREASDLGPADLMAVEIEGEDAVIPNLEFLESLAAPA